MDFKLYTTVDITNTGQYRSEQGKETARWQEQNFQTVLQTLGIRANVSYYNKPVMTSVKGELVGFATKKLIKAWRFDFYTERDALYEKDGDPVGYLIEDFDGIPYINGLNEGMEQNYSVFVTDGPAQNIVFSKKQ